MRPTCERSADGIDEPRILAQIDAEPRRIEPAAQHRIAELQRVVIRIGALQRHVLGEHDAILHAAGVGHRDRVGLFGGAGGRSTLGFGPARAPRRRNISRWSRARFSGVTLPMTTMVVMSGRRTSVRIGENVVARERRDRFRRRRRATTDRPSGTERRAMAREAR